MSVKDLSDRLDKIEVKTEHKRKNNRNGKVGINKHNNYTPDKYAPRKSCVKCGSVNHLSTNCKSVVNAPMPVPQSVPRMSVQPMLNMPAMNAMPAMSAMPNQSMNSFANMPFAQNPYYAAFNMPHMPYSMPYWNNMCASPMSYNVNANVPIVSTNESVTSCQTPMAKVESQSPQSSGGKTKKSKKKVDKTGPKETWVPKLT